MPDIYFPHLGIALEDVNRVAFSLGGINIFWYGILIATAVLAAAFFCVREVKRTGQNVDHYYELLGIGIFAAIIGLRLFYVAFNWEAYAADPIRIITGIRMGGLAIYGGIIASVVAVFAVSRWRKMDMRLVLDTCAPVFALGQAIGRWGNFINREAFGEFTNSLFAMRLRLPGPGDGFGISASNITQCMRDNMVAAYGAQYIQVHPTFLYESAWNLAVFVALTLYRPRKRFHGEIFGLYLLCYGVARFFIEGLRTDQLLLAGLPVNQLLSGGLAVGAAAVLAYFWVRVWQKRKKA